MRTKRVTFIIVLLLLLVIPISTAFAEPLFDTTVGENETVNNDVIVFDGDLMLEEGSVVNGDVVVFNGDVVTSNNGNEFFQEASHMRQEAGIWMALLSKN